MAMAVDAMRQSHDLVILDLPAVLESSDAAPLADLADGIVFVARSGATPRAAVQNAFAQLDQARLRGTVLNGAGSAIPRWLSRFLGL
jgi:Mrp family chromosome partitioning ATPase